MSNQVDRVGTFRFDKVLSVGLSIGESVSEDDPQPRSITFSAILHLSEFWDTETSEWVDWADAAVEMVASLPLHFFDKKTEEQAEFSIRKKVVEVFGWDGASFKGLCAGDYSKVTGQIRMEDDTYKQAKYPFKVAWLDTFDATPGRQLRQITGDNLKNLDKIMAATLKKSAKPAKAASAKRAATKGKSKGRPKLPAKPLTTKTEAPVGKCTDQEAYDKAFGLKRDDIDEEALNVVWLAEIAKVNADEAQITEEQWFGIGEAVVKQTSKV